MNTPRLNPTQAQIYSVIKRRKKGFTRRELEDICNRRSGTICGRVRDLFDKGLLEVCGRRKDPYSGKSVEVVRMKQ